MIRGVIREFTSGATGTGGASQHKGRQSQTTKAAKRSLDTKKSDYKTKKATSSSKASKVDNSKHYRKANARGPGYTYSSTLQRGYSVNPAWTTQDAESRSARTAELSAKSAEAAAQTTFDSAEEDDLRKSTPTQKPPTSGGSYGKGKKKN
jgi:hypothetical protein